MASLECPRCGLFSPDTAQRCDCGYDFETLTVEKVYFTQELPRQVRGFVVLLITLNVLVGLADLAAAQPGRIVVVVAWSGLVWWLYSQLVAKRNWARLWLIVVTVPIGLLLGLSREVKLYCLQK